MKASKVITIGVMPQTTLRERVLAIARGDYKPKASDPKIWFTSMKAAASVLSDENRTLLRTIATTQPASIAALAAETGANVRRVSRTLATLSRYGRTRGADFNECLLSTRSRPKRYDGAVAT